MLKLLHNCNDFTCFQGNAQNPSSKISTVWELRTSRRVSSVQFSSVTQSCPILCDPMDCSMPGLHVHHQLLELIQTHVHGVSYAIQPPHPLSSPSLPTFNLSQHQDLFKWVSSLHQVAIKKAEHKGTLSHCWWECKLVQPLWRTVWRFLKKLELELPYDPEIPLLGIHTEETRIERYVYPNAHHSTIYNSQDMDAT